MGHHSVLSFIPKKIKMMMLKQVFALALLSHSVFGRFTSFDRQLVEGADQGTGNEWQYCEDTCNKTCEPCEQHHVCADDEIKCGEGPTRVSPDGFVLHLCAKDEICVSDKCGCPVPGNDGELCPVVCECDCNDETEICCPAERTQMAAQSNQLVNQKAQTCTMKSVLASVSNHA